MQRQDKRGMRISLLDQLWLGSTTVVAAGPIELPARQQLAQSLFAVASAGPNSRVGLGFDPSGRGWRFDRDGLWEWCDAAVEQIEPTPDLDALMGELGRTACVERPLRIVVSGDFAVLAVRHALGDARLVTSLFDTLLTHSSTGELADWVHEPVDAHPLRSALTETFVRDRSGLGRLVRQLRAPVHSVEPSATAQSPATVAFVPDPVVVNVAGTAAMRKVINRGAPHLAGASQTALTLAVVQLALADEGIRCADGVHVVVDARRYLPSGHATHGNFVVGLNLPAMGTDPMAVTKATAEATEAGRPLAALSASVAKQLRPRRDAGAERISVAPEAQLAMSFIGKVRGIERLPWTVPAEGRRYFCRVEPAGPTAITLVPTVAGNALMLSMSFHRSVFDPALVRSALERVCAEPAELLSRLGPR